MMRVFQVNRLPGCRSFQGRESAFTFLEIVVAMAVLAVALIPIFGIIHKGAEETDFNASQAYAINKASEILNAMLDNIPFEAIRAGNPAVLKTADLAGIRDYDKFDDTWCRKMAEMLFPNGDKAGGGYACKGIHTDPRGISYLVTLKVEDVCASVAPSDEKPENLQIGSGYPTSTPNDFPEHPRGDLTFSFLRNPAKLSSPKWLQAYNPNPTGSSLAGLPRWETELPANVSEPAENIYLDEGYGGFSANAPRFIDPTAARYTQRMAADKVNYTTDDRYAYCTMKKLIIEVQWNLEKALYSDPETEGKGCRRIHLMTLKGDISR